MTKRKGSNLLCRVPCTGKKGLRTESCKHVEDILKAGLATIQEEPEEDEEEKVQATGRRHGRKKAKREKFKLGRRVMQGFTSLGDTYVHLMIAMAGKGNLAGLTSC